MNDTPNESSNSTPEAARELIEQLVAACQCLESSRHMVVPSDEAVRLLAAALAAEAAKWQEMLADEREDATQWLREHNKEMKRANAAEAALAAGLREAADRAYRECVDEFVIWKRGLTSDTFGHAEGMRFVNRIEELRTLAAEADQ